MTSRSTYMSDDELVRKLLGSIRSTPATDATGGLLDGHVDHVRWLAGELAERIYDDPRKWGLSSIPDEFRDDATSDALVALVFSVPARIVQEPIVDWFASTVEAKFQQLWVLAERQNVERDRLAEEKALEPSVDIIEDRPLSGQVETPMFETDDGAWPNFEAEFPRDAFALRLRYHLKRDIAQMVVMLDAPSPRAIIMRLDRARDRFGMFCERHGMRRRDVSALMNQISEETQS